MDGEENMGERIGFDERKIQEQVFRGKERYRKGERLCQRAIKQERVQSQEGLIGERVTRVARGYRS